MDDIKTMQYLNIEKVNQNKIDLIENKYFKIPHHKISNLNRSSNLQYNPISAISKKLSFSELKLHDLNEDRIFEHPDGMLYHPVKGNFLNRIKNLPPKSHICIDFFIFKIAFKSNKFIYIE